jgi:hypothetical protein
MSQGSALDGIRDEVLGGAGAGGSGENDAELIAEWPNCSPQSVLAELHKVGEVDKGTNKKGFWATYSKDWMKLSSNQHSNCRLFYQNLTDPVKKLVLEKALAATIAADTAKAQANKSSDAARKANTTKNEVARVMHLVKDADAPAAGGLQSMDDEGDDPSFLEWHFAK